MNFTQHASSSKGNLYEVESLGRRILVDCGLSWKKVLRAISHDLTTVDGILLTHRHGDHSKSIVEATTKGCLDVYSSKETLDKVHPPASRRIHYIEAEKPFKIGPFDVYPFEVIHSDIHGNVHNLGFIITDETGDRLLFAIDTTYIPVVLQTKITHLAIEANYDEIRLIQSVEEGNLPDFISDRIRRSHMNWQETLRYASEDCDLSQCREIHLLHMSSTNIDKAKVVQAFQDQFAAEVITDGL